MSDLPKHVAYQGYRHEVFERPSGEIYLIQSPRPWYAQTRRTVVTREQVLALKTWAEHKAERDERRGPRAHCQICGREIGIKAGVIAHHGYERPGHGYQTKSCFGARKLPYQKSRDAIPEFSDMLIAMVAEKNEQIARLSDPAFSGDFKKTITRWSIDKGNHKAEVVIVKSEEPQTWGHERINRVRNIELFRDAVQEDIDRLRSRYESWELVE